MKRIISIGLLGLLLFHVLTYGLVLWYVNWQEERDLTHCLTVYRTVDSIVEFYVPLQKKGTASGLQETPNEGFTYQGNYYEIVRQEVSNDTLHILGYANTQHSFWQQDLLDFIRHQFVEESGQSQKKAGHWLKNLLKEYYSVRRLSIDFLPPQWRQSAQFSAFSSFLPDRALLVHSPPPKV